jgi:starvation-inducible DNA-binding protein
MNQTTRLRSVPHTPRPASQHPAHSSLPLNGIRENDARAVADQLRSLLADTFVLKMKTRSALWNITGQGARNLHALAEALYQDLEIATDSLARRIRALGFLAPRTVAELLDAGDLKEPGQPLPSDSMPELLQQLSTDNQFICRKLRELVGIASTARDLVTVELLTSRLTSHEDAVWMLRARISK